MFQRMIDDFKGSVGTALRLTSLAAAAVVALFIATSFLCAAAFVYVLQNYGLVQACLTGAGIFFVVTLIAAGCYMMRKNQLEAGAAGKAKSARHSALAVPMVVSGVDARSGDWRPGLRPCPVVPARPFSPSAIVCVRTGGPDTCAARSALMARLADCGAPMESGVPERPRPDANWTAPNVSATA